jgi:hypothetical protein
MQGQGGQGGTGGPATVSGSNLIATGGQGGEGGNGGGSLGQGGDGGTGGTAQATGLGTAVATGGLGGDGGTGGTAGTPGGAVTGNRGQGGDGGTGGAAMVNGSGSGLAVGGNGGNGGGRGGSAGQGGVATSIGGGTATQGTNGSSGSGVPACVANYSVANAVLNRSNDNGVLSGTWTVDWRQSPPALTAVSLTITGGAYNGDSFQVPGTVLSPFAPISSSSPGNFYAARIQNSTNVSDLWLMFEADSGVMQHYFGSTHVSVNGRAQSLVFQAAGDVGTPSAQCAP